MPVILLCTKLKTDIVSLFKRFDTQTSSKMFLKISSDVFGNLIDVKYVLQVCPDTILVRKPEKLHLIEISQLSIFCLAVDTKKN